MTTVPVEILNSCDIRGTYPKPLGNPQAEQIGWSLGTLIKGESHRNIKVIVGRDARHSSENLHRSLIQGLRNTGLKIVDAGMVSSPLLAFSTRFSGASVGVMVTASHHPADYNGFKFFVEGTPAPVSWIERLYGVLKSQIFRKGAGIVERKNFFPDYRNSLVNTIAQNFQGIKMVVDAGNGMAALTAPMVFEALHCDVKVLNEKLDGDFPGRGAASSDPQGLEVLGTIVRREKAQIGVSFDGDGDGVSFVDEKGREIPNESILCLFAKDLLIQNKNARVVYDAKCSDWVEKTVREAGGTAIIEKSGHTFIFSRMRKEKAFLGGEACGHFFLPGPFPGDSLYATLRLLEILKGDPRSLSQMCSDFPSRVTTRDIEVEFSKEQYQNVLEGLKSHAVEMGAQVSNLDGIRAVFKDGWGIVQPSVAGFFLSFRLEAPTKTQLTKLITEWFQGFPEIQQLILKRYAEF